MNINGKNITHEDLLNSIDEAVYEINNQLYNILVEEYDQNGKVGIIKGGPYKVRKELNNLMEYFIKTEEYEKCGKLKQMKEKYYGLS